MKFEEMNLPKIAAIAKVFENRINCTDLEAYQLALQSFQVQASQEQTKAIKELTNAIKDGLGVTSTNSTPKFIEAVAMAIGYYKDSPSLVEVLFDVKEELSNLNEKFPPYIPEPDYSDHPMYKTPESW